MTKKKYQKYNNPKAVIQYLEREEIAAKKRGYTTKAFLKTRGVMPSLSVYTEMTWIHENTGEEHRESYFYRVSND